MFDKFSVEEINLMCVFDTSDKTALLADLQVGLDGIYEPEMREVFESTIERLETVTDEEFAEIGFFVADDTGDFDDFDSYNEAEV